MFVTAGSITEHMRNIVQYFDQTFLERISRLFGSQFPLPPLREEHLFPGKNVTHQKLHVAAAVHVPTLAVRDVDPDCKGERTPTRIHTHRERQPSCGERDDGLALLHTA